MKNTPARAAMHFGLGILQCRTCQLRITASNRRFNLFDKAADATPPVAVNRLKFAIAADAFFSLIYG